MEKSGVPMLDGEFQDFTLRNIHQTLNTDTPVEEVYVDQTTGETITELIGDSVNFLFFQDSYAAEAFAD